MSIYRVVCYQGAQWDRQEPCYVEADNQSNAAKKVCGEGLIATGRVRDLRALVIEVSNPSDKFAFFNPPSAAEARLEQPEEPRQGPSSTPAGPLLSVPQASA